MFKLITIIFLAFTVFVNTTFANLYIVMNANINGTGSLDEAVSFATSNPGPDTIGFNPVLTGSQITLNASLYLTGVNANGTIINGDINFDGIPDIELIGSQIVPCFVIGASNCVISGFAINGFTDAIFFDGKTYPLAVNNAVISNFIGTNLAGNGPPAMPNVNAGIYILESKYVTIGDTTVQSKNVISGNGGPGILIKGSDSIKIIGNFIGTDVIGNMKLPNIFEGIAIDSFSKFIEIGNETNFGKNLISGNNTAGILITNNASYVKVINNNIGTNIAGNDTISNGPGIAIQGFVDNIMIGNPNSVNGGNLISGNRVAGVHVAFGSGPEPQFIDFYGNNIGLQMDKITPLPNTGAGLFIEAGRMIQIGDGTVNGRNVISGNDAEGIALNEFSGSNKITGLTILGNNIGTDWSGNIPVPNMGVAGIAILAVAPSTVDSILIGNGTTVGRNIISGNFSDGLNIIGDGSFGPEKININNNLIGLAIDGYTPLGNGLSGIHFDLGARSNKVENNTIAYNGQIGIGIFGFATVENTLFKNSIYNNGVAGIFVDTVANMGVAMPTIDSMSIDSTLFGRALPSAFIQVYADSFAQGKLFMDTARADAGGNWQVKVPFFPIGMEFAAIQDSIGNTSNFSFPFGGYFMHGNVFNGVSTDTVSDGKVFLFLNEQGINNPYKLVDSASIGEVFFNEYDLGPYFPSKYLLLAVPDINIYPSTLPTYYMSSTRWFNANALTLTSDSNVNITAKQIIPQAGTGTIKGHIKKGQGVGKIQGPGDPFNGVDVSLIDKSTGSAVARTMSEVDTIAGDSGVFVFNNVMDGSYIIHADIAGIPIDTSTVYDITAGNQSVTNILVTVDSSYISFSVASGIKDKKIVQSEFNIYPNPFKRDAFINYKVNKDQFVQLVLYDILGHKVSTLVAQKHSVGRYVYILNKNKLNIKSGNYFVKMISEDKETTRKIIILN